MGSCVEIGTQLEGRFTIRDELASRGSRTIYFGSDTLTDKRCEVHVLAFGASKAQRVEFTREAELLGRIDHPGCLSAASAGGLPDGTLYYIVSERAGSRITDRQGTELPTFHVADAAAQLLRALDHVHQQDWRLGWLTPDQVDERLDQGHLVVRIVRMSSARPDGEAGPVPTADEAAYAAPALRAGQVATTATELYTVGQIIGQLAAGDVGIGLPQGTAAQQRLSRLVDTLCGHPGTSPFASASQAAGAFEEICSTWQGAMPIVPPVARSSGRGRFRTSDIAGIETRTPVVAAVAAATPRHEPDSVQARVGRATSGGVTLEPAPSPLRRWWPALAIGLIAVVGGVAFLKGSGSTTAASDDATQTAAVGTPAQAAGAADGTAAPAGARSPAAASGTQPAAEVPSGLLDNPMRAIAVLNRTDLERVPGFAERHALLGEIDGRPDLRARVDMRWNRLLDLVQADQAPQPCSTFRAALVELETAPRNPAEQTLLDAVRVPTPETVLGAGVAPDGECTGLPEAFAQAVARHQPAATETRSHRSTSRSRHTNKKATTPSPAATPANDTPPKNKDAGPEVATRLDDLKGVDF